MMATCMGRRGRIFSLFCLVGILLYASALDSVLTYDDDHQIVLNPSIRSVNNIPAMFADVSTSSRRLAAAKHYRPLLLSSFTLNYALDALDPKGYHLVNLAFHIGSAFMIYLIVGNLLGLGGLTAVAGGLVMLTHPFNSEVVNYVTARSSVMATFFYLLAFYAYVRYRPPQVGRTWMTPVGEGLGGASATSVGTQATEHPSRKWLWISCGAFLMGLLTKEILITLPTIILLYELTFTPASERPWRRVLWNLLPYFGLVVTYFALRKVMVGQIGPTDAARGFWDNLLIQVKALAITWRLLLVPNHLSIEHPTPVVSSLSDVGLWLSLGLLVASVTAMVVLIRSQYRPQRVIGFFLAWFYITLLPTLVVPLNAVIQENRGYIAIVGFAVILGIVAQGLYKISPSRVRPVVLSLMGGLVIVYGIGVWERNQAWESEVTLWEDAVLKSPGIYGPHFGLASAYFKEGKPAQSEAEYLEAIRIDGSKPVVHNDLASLYAETKRRAEAIHHFQEAIRVGPKYDLSYSNLGMVYRDAGRTQDAIQVFKMALRLNPVNETALVHLGTLYQVTQPGRAESLYAYALSLNPNLPKVLMEVGLIHQQKGDHHAAIRYFDKAASLDPAFVGAYMALGQEYIVTQRYQEAIAPLQYAISLQPDEGLGYLTLGKLYEQIGDREKAVALYQKVLTLRTPLGENDEAIQNARLELKRLHQIP